MLALKLARRELRGGARRLWVVLACLALAVATIAGVGSLRAGVQQGLAADGNRLLGGDLEVQGGSQPIPEAVRHALVAAGARVSAVTQLRSMLVASSGERQLVELKAVDTAWPLVGRAELAPPQSLADALGEQGGRFGLAAAQVVLDRLRLRPGDVARIGTATFVVRAALTDEPDRATAGMVLAPRVLVAAAALPSTELVQPGAMLSHALRAALPPGRDPVRFADELRARFGPEGLRVRDAAHAAPGLARFVDQTALFLTMVGLTALLVGGIGVANGVATWLQARARSIAALRCLGAEARLIFQVYLIQVMALCGLGVLAGLAIGAGLPVLLVGFFGTELPVPSRIGLYPLPLMEAAAYGLLTAATFALWPLARAARIPAATLFRDDVLPQRVRPSWRLLATTLALTAGLIALTLATAPDTHFAAYFCAAALATLGLFRLGSAALMAAARRIPLPTATWIRLGVANVHRPGTATPLLLVSMGLGLSTLAAVALILGNLRQEILGALPTAAPSFYFVDIQTAELPGFELLLKQAHGVAAVRHVPNLRARLVAVNGTPAEQVRATPETRWALRGDRGLTYAADLPEGSRLVAGSWWPHDYAGPPLVSFDAELARGWGVRVGDTITVNVLGREISLKVASLRTIDWRSLGINFTLVASPGFLEGAPQTHIATVRATPAEQGAILRAVTDAFPNVSGIRVEDVLASIATVVGRIGVALTVIGSLTLTCGALVLAGAVAAGRRRRIREAVILKVLGATRRQIRSAWLVEFGVLGATAGLLAALIGTLASLGVIRYIMDIDWVFLPTTLGATTLGSIVLMLVLGHLGTTAALRARPAPLLRND
jgi:putative ABC transport system permease protein